MGAREDRLLEAEDAAELFKAELAKVKDWGVREILHYLMDVTTVPTSARAGEPVPAAVRQAIDNAHGYTPPEPALSDEEERQLSALLEKQRLADEARAAKRAAVVHTDDTGG